MNYVNFWRWLKLHLVPIQYRTSLLWSSTQTGLFYFFRRTFIWQKERLRRHLSLSFIALVFVGTNSLASSTASNDQLAQYLPTSPDVIAQIVSDLGKFTPLINENPTTVSEQLAGIEQPNYITQNDFIMVADNSPDSVGGAGIEYVVQKGDSYVKIASQFGLRSASVLAANGIDETKIKANPHILDLHENQKIVVPFENIDDGPNGWIDIVNSIAAAQTPPTSKSNKSKNSSKPLSKLLSRSSGRDYNSYAGFTAGWCTAYAAKVRPDVASAVRSAGGGNAARWGSAARSAGLRVDKNAAVGAIVGTWESAFGHVAQIEQVKGDSVVIGEYNGPAGRGRYDQREIPKSMIAFVIH